MNYSLKYLLIIGALSIIGFKESYACINDSVTIISEGGSTAFYFLAIILVPIFLSIVFGFIVVKKIISLRKSIKEKKNEGKELRNKSIFITIWALFFLLFSLISLFILEGLFFSQTLGGI